MKPELNAAIGVGALGLGDLRTPRVRTAAGLLRARRRTWPAATWCRATSGPCSTRCAPRRGARTSCRRRAGPPTRRPVGCHTPSFCSTIGRGGGDARAWAARAAGSAGSVGGGALVLGGRVGDGVLHLDRARACRRSGGGLFVYHQRSIVFTMPLPPWSRTHSTLHRHACRCRGVAGSRRTTPRPGSSRMTTAMATPRRIHFERFERCFVVVVVRRLERLGGCLLAFPLLPELAPGERCRSIAAVRRRARRRGRRAALTVGAGGGAGAGAKTDRRVRRARPRRVRATSPPGCRRRSGRGRRRSRSGGWRGRTRSGSGYALALALRGDPACGRARGSSLRGGRRAPAARPGMAGEISAQPAPATRSRPCDGYR